MALSVVLERGTAAVAVAGESDDWVGLRTRWESRALLDDVCVPLVVDGERRVASLEQPSPVWSIQEAKGDRWTRWDEQTELKSRSQLGPNIGT